VEPFYGKVPAVLVSTGKKWYIGGVVSSFDVLEPPLLKRAFSQAAPFIGVRGFE
jgi:hypothetical protein